MLEREVLVCMEEGQSRGTLYKNGMLKIGSVTYSPGDDEDLPRSIPDSAGEEIDINILIRYYLTTELEMQIAKLGTPLETLSGAKISI